MKSDQSNGSHVDLKTLLREDYVRNRGALSPGFHAVAVYHFGRWAETLAHPARTLLRVLYKVLYGLVRNLYSIEIPVEARIGRRLLIAHQGSIVIHPLAIIGDDCLLRQNCTIGLGATGRMVPTVGDRVQVGPGAVLAGGITVGDDAHIGPNAVVMSDVPPGGSAFAAPARMIKPADKQMPPAGEASSSGTGS